PAAAAETVPSMDLAGQFGGLAAPSPRRRKSPAGTWAALLGTLGALGGGMLIILLKTNSLDLIEALVRMFPGAGVNAICGAVLGSVSGLVVGGMVVTFAGRSIWSLLGLLVVMAAGGIFGALHEASPFDMGWTILVVGGVAGALAGALLGALVGAIIGASR